MFSSKSYLIFFGMIKKCIHSFNSLMISLLLSCYVSVLVHLLSREEVELINLNRKKCSQSRDMFDTSDTVMHELPNATSLILTKLPEPSVADHQAESGATEEKCYRTVATLPSRM